MWQKRKSISSSRWLAQSHFAPSIAALSLSRRRPPNDIAHGMRPDHVLAGDGEDHIHERQGRVHGRSVRIQFLALPRFKIELGESLIKRKD